MQLFYSHQLNMDLISTNYSTTDSQNSDFFNQNLEGNFLQNSLLQINFQTRSQQNPIFHSRGFQTFSQPIVRVPPSPERKVWSNSVIDLEMKLSLRQNHFEDKIENKLSGMARQIANLQSKTLSQKAIREMISTSENESHGHMVMMAELVQRKMQRMETRMSTIAEIVQRKTQGLETKIFTIGEIVQRKMQRLETRMQRMETRMSTIAEIFQRKAQSLKTRMPKMQSNQRRKRTYINLTVKRSTQI